MAAPPATTPTPAATRAVRGPGDALRRVTYLMLFRIVVATLLLGAAVAAELATSTPFISPTAPALFAVIALTYGLTLVWALLLRRARRAPTALAAAGRRLAQAQVACDLLTSTLLVHLTGGIDSGLVVLYLLVVVGASTVLSPRATLVATAAAALLYLGVGIGGRLGWLPAWPGTALLEGPLGPSVRTIGIHLVALCATAILANRLSADLQRAGEHIVAQGALLANIATLHDDVVRSLPSGLITLSDGGVIHSINPAGAAILGSSSPSVVGRLLADAWPEIAASLERSDGPLHRSEVAIHDSRSADGAPRIIGLSASPLFDARRRAIGRVVSFQDLSELKQMQVQVERATRLAAIGRLAAGVAHEIRNPLAAISGSIELLRASQSPSSEGESRELWDIVEREVTRLNALISDLLDFASSGAPGLAPLEVGSVVAELLKIFEGDRRLGGGRVQLEAPAPLWVEADPGRMRQVLWNLVRNAADASPTPSDQPILVSAVAERSHDGREWVRLSVRDHGSGIPEQHRARLCEPFFTTKPGGTGLGLALVHRIIEEHRGRFEIENADGGGALATMWLPRRAAP